MLRSWAGVVVAVAACGNPSHGGGDASAGDTSSGDGNAIDATAIDGSVDARTDAFASLSPDPLDPVSLPCPGLLGFPGLPSVFPEDIDMTVAIADVSGDSLPDLVYVTFSGIFVARGNGN